MGHTTPKDRLKQSGKRWQVYMVSLFTNGIFLGLIGSYSIVKKTLQEEIHIS